MLDAATCSRKGLCPVTKIRHQDTPLESHSLYFEQHGTGPEKIVFVMGLNGTFLSWINQVKHFGRSSRYSLLVFDNRGVGNSTTPKGPYSTSGMAEDVVVLLDYLGWTDARSVHLVGISLGGMIAQELSARIPERFISLTLAVTTPGGAFWNNIPPWFGFWSLLRLFLISDRVKKVPLLLEMVFSSDWLNAPAENDPQGRTNREVQRTQYEQRMTFVRPQQPLGALSQMFAGLSHHVTAARLRQIAASVPKITIVTGDQDHLVAPANSKYLHENMPGSELVIWEGTGHGVQIQRAELFNQLLERTFEEGRAKAAQEGSESEH
ncbi:alpha/beta-hydrolase [Amylostereum chailletii]|nr:alpha/beta-hydrolase [Amylostereum chailletii]